MARPLENTTQVVVKTRKELREWLEANHLQKKKKK